MMLYHDIPISIIISHYINHQYWFSRQGDTIGMLFDGIMESFECKMQRCKLFLQGMHMID